MALNIISSISLDMQAPYSTVNLVHVNQYDSGKIIKATLLDAGQRWEVPAGAKAIVAFKKTDNTGGFYDVTDEEPHVQAVSVDNDRSIIYISLDTQTTTTATARNKYVDMQIVFYQNGKRLSTFAFYMSVHASAVTSKDVTSSWIFNILSQEIAATLSVATTPQAMTDWLDENIKVQDRGYLIDYTLTLEDYAADAQATGKMVTVSDTDPNTVANKIWIKKTSATLDIPTMDDLTEINDTFDALSPELTADHFKWELGKSVSENGTVITSNNSYALTDIIPVNEGSIIVNTKPDIGEDDQITVLFIATYSHQTFVAPRIALSYNNRYTIPSGINGIRFAYGYTTQNVSPKVMTPERLNTYFGVKIIQSIDQSSDKEYPVYVAFGASTTEGDVHHYSGESITVSEYNYPDYIGRVLNLKTYNLAVGSTGLLKRGDPSYPSYGTKPNIMDQIYANDAILSQAKLVTIMFAYGNDNTAGSQGTVFPIGSYTDYYPYDEEGYHPSGVEGMDIMLNKGATLMGCLNWCIKWISTKYPYAQLIVMFGSPSANSSRRVTMTAQTEGYGVAPYTLTFRKDPFKESENPTGASYGVYLINEQLKDLKEALDVPIINMYYDEAPFNWYSIYAKNPDNDSEYALFSTGGTVENPSWNSHPNDLGYKYFARFVAGKVISLFKH